MVLSIIRRRRRRKADDHAVMANRLSALLARQIEALEQGEDTAFSEETVKALLLLGKTLQAMQEATKRADQAEREERDGETGHGSSGSSGDGWAGGRDGDIAGSHAGDLVEFRHELARRILALDPERPAGRIPDPAEP